MQRPVATGGGRFSLAVREPVRMDLTYHGARFISIEFVFMTVVSVGLAALEIGGYLAHGHSWYNLAWAGIFGLLAANALTFWLLAREIVRHTTLPTPSAYTGREIFVYTVEAVLLLLLPGVFPVLALLQRQL